MPSDLVKPCTRYLLPSPPPFPSPPSSPTQVCSEPYLQSEYGAEYGTQSPVKLLDRLYYGFPQTEEEELVVLSQVLACDATLGYDDLYNVQLVGFNGQPVRNLRHLAEMVLACKEKYCRFDLEYNEVRPSP